MQSRRRTGRSIKSDRAIARSCQRSAPTRFALSILLCGLVAACARTQPSSTYSPNNQIKVLADHVAKLCLSGEGKGRIRFLEERHIFRYESKWDLKQKRYDLVMDLPAYGEEALALLWDQNNKRGWDIKGSFYQRLDLERKKQVNKELYEFELLDEYLASLSLFFSFYDNLILHYNPQIGAKQATALKEELVNCRADESSNSEKQSGQCQFRGQTIRWTLDQSAFSFESSLNPRYQMTLKYSDMTSNFYRKLQLALSKQQSGAVPSSPLELTLFASDCQNLF